MSYPPSGQPYPGGYSVPLRTSGLAVGSLVCSLIFCIPVTSLVGLILGLCALPGVNSGKVKGKGVALAGIIVGALGLLVVFPLEAYGCYKLWDFGMGTVAKPAVVYARAVAANDLAKADALSVAPWTHADNESLAAALSQHGTVTDATRHSFHVSNGPSGKGTFVVHVDLTFSDGKTVTLSVQLQPQQGQHQKPEDAFLVEGAQVLP